MAAEECRMQIAVLSGKGGTGKTFVSVNLAAALEGSYYLDCDVEEPNGWIFLKPQLEETRPVAVLYPKVDETECTGCKACVDFCKFNALSYVDNKLLVFPQMCHSCGGCILLCPQEALFEVEREIGRIEYGKAGGVHTRTGILEPGEPSGVPIIRQLLEGLPHEKTIVLDCPPGSSCTVMDSIQDSDYCLLVTEPTRFGLHNLALVLELVRLMDKPHGVVINKAQSEQTIAHDYCAREGLSVLETIPFDSKLGLLISNGKLAVEDGKYRQLFQRLLEKIIEEVDHETAGNFKR
jgi:MinD superfamily P-loop ATPase